MALKQFPVWLEGAAFPKLEAGRPLPAHVDVAIVGAGYTGLAAARALGPQRRERSPCSRHARSAGAPARGNGGMVLTGLALRPRIWWRATGLPAARRMFAAALASIDWVEQVVREEAIDCEFQRSGQLLLVSKPAHFRAFEHEAALLAREFGHPTRLLPPRDLRAEIGSGVYHGGLLDEASAGIDPARYVAGLGHSRRARRGAAVRAGRGERLTR